MRNVTKKLVEQIKATPPYADLSKETKVNLKKGLFDYFICSHAAAIHDPHFTKIMNTAMYDSGDATIIGTNRKVHPFDACLINGYAAHALDLDDVHSAIRGHPSAVIISLLVSLIECEKDTERFHEAYLVGVEVMTRLAKILGTEHYEKGFHTTATAGLYGAVAAGAYYLQFSDQSYEQALDLCVSQISGSRSHFGTLIKPLHAGITGQKAWQILHFVSHGVAGSENTIAVKNGLLPMYGIDQPDVQLLTSEWGSPWAIDSPGLWFKLYPCCSATAHPIDATKKLMERYSFHVNEIERINLYFPPNGDAALVYSMPENGEQGRFSAEYCVALLLYGEELSIQNFTIEQIPKRIKALMAKMNRCYDSTIKAYDWSFPKNRYCIVEIMMQNGIKYQARTDVPHGSPGNPFEINDLIFKANQLFTENAEKHKWVRIFQEKEIVTIDDMLTMMTNHTN